MMRDGQWGTAGDCANDVPRCDNDWFGGVRLQPGLVPEVQALGLYEGTAPKF